MKTLLEKIKTKHRLRKAMRQEQRQQLKKIPTHFDRAILEWETPQYIYHEKSRKWFMIFAGVIAGFALYAILSKDFLFAAAIILFGVIYPVLQREKPKNITVTISHNGIKIGDEAYSYNQIQTFWVIYEPPYVQTLNFRINKKFMPDITLNLEDQDPAILRHVLGNFLPEWQDRQETFSETLIRLLRL